MKYFIFWKTKAWQTAFSCEEASITFNWTGRIKEMDTAKVKRDSGFNNAMQLCFNARLFFWNKMFCFSYQWFYHCSLSQTDAINAAGICCSSIARCSKIRQGAAVTSCHHKITLNLSTTNKGQRHFPLTQFCQKQNNANISSNSIFEIAEQCH